MAGLADPVYAEAYVTVHQYDIVLDVTVINRTDATMQVGTRIALTFYSNCLCGRYLCDLQPKCAKFQN